MIAIGSDHGGFNLKAHIIEYFEDKGIGYKNFGVNSNKSVDYPDIARETVQEVINGNCEFAILVCGSGIGMSMAANKLKGIRAAVCSDVYSAKMTRLHNDANVLCLGERVVGSGLAIMMVEEFLKTHFEGGRHKIRVESIE